MKLNRKLVLVLALLLSVAMATTGTLAYLSDTDADVNVMTLGNVKIEQHEYERVFENGKPVEGEEGVDFTANYGITESYKLQPFTQGKPAYPAVYTQGELIWDDFQQLWNQVGAPGSNDLFDDSVMNVIDKFVFVENTGKSDAYYRTIIAVELPEGMDADLIHVNMNANARFDYDQDKEGVQDPEHDNTFYITVNGSRYLVYVVHYTEVLTPGEVSRPSLLQLFLDPACTNEDVALFGDTWDVLVVTQAVQAAGFSDAQTALDTAFGKVTTTSHPWSDQEPQVSVVSVGTAAELQAALDAATDGTTIVLTADIDGNVTVTQKPGVAVTIEGANNTFAGVITVDGKSGTYLTAGLTIKNVVFKADAISADACIQLGNGTNATRYTCNVTVEGCTFDVPGAVGIKSYTGGDKNLTVVKCTATANAHSLMQAKGIDGILVKDCTVNSVRGMNFNNSNNVVVEGCAINVEKYALRFGESNNSVVENYAIKNCTIKSANGDGDAAIIFRAGALDAKLTLVNTTIDAGIEYQGKENVTIVNN